MFLNSGRTSEAATNWLSLNHTWDVPDSCCVKVTVDCGKGGVNVTDETKIHQTVSSCFHDHVIRSFFGAVLVIENKKFEKVNH